MSKEWKPSNQPTSYDYARVDRLRPITHELDKLNLKVGHYRKVMTIVDALEIQIEDGGDSPETNALLLGALQAAVLHQVDAHRGRRVLEAIHAFEQAEAKRWEQVKTGTLPPIELSPTEQLESLVWAGYHLLQRDQTPQACDRWLEAWEIFKGLLPEQRVGKLMDLDAVYAMDDLSLVDWTSDLEMELQNAGREDPIYYEHRVRYAREVLAQFPQEAEFYLQYRRAEGEALWKLGRQAEAETVYEALVKHLPDEGWAYIGWADHHWLFDVTDPEEYAQAEQILRLALARPNLVDRGDVFERLADLYERWGKPEQQAEALAEMHAVEKIEASKAVSPVRRNAPVLPPKPTLGRNDLCWCGSGKKYKHCHRKSDLGTT